MSENVQPDIVVYGYRVNWAGPGASTFFNRESGSQMHPTLEPDGGGGGCPRRMSPRISTLPA